MESTKGMVYFYGDAAMRLGKWEFIKNDKMNISSLKLEEPERFRFIRVNTTDEVPDYYIENKGKSDFQKVYYDFFRRVSNSPVNYKVDNEIKGKLDIKELKLDTDIKYSFYNKLLIEGCTEINLEKQGIKNMIFVAVNLIKVEEKIFPVIYRMSDYKNEIILYGEELNKDDEGERIGKKIPSRIKQIEKDVFKAENEIVAINKIKFLNWIEETLKNTDNKYNEDIYILCPVNMKWAIKDIAKKRDIGSFNKVNWINEDEDMIIWELSKYDEYRKNHRKPICKTPEHLIDNRNRGLFTENNHTFYSIGERPDTMKSMSLSETKVSSPGKPLTKQSAVEMIVVGTEDEAELLQIGRVSHHLRKLNLTFPVHAQLPLPMFILAKHKKYITAFGKCSK